MKPSHRVPESHHTETRTHIHAHPAAKSRCSKPMMLWFPKPAAIAQRQRGVTGMETAIILFAFVVVASIYAFTVLSTGIFSADKGKGTIRAGLSEPSGPIELEGSTVGEGSPDITPPLHDSNRPAVATSSSNGHRAGLTADTVDKREDSASVNFAPSATSTIDIMAPRTPPPLSPIVDPRLPSALDQYGLD